MSSEKPTFVSQFQPVAISIGVSCSNLSLPFIAAQSVRVVVYKRDFDALAEVSAPAPWKAIGATELQPIAECMQFAKEVGVLYEFHERCAIRVCLCAGDGSDAIAPDIVGADEDGMAALSLSDGEDVLLEDQAVQQLHSRAEVRLSSRVDDANPFGGDDDWEESFGPALAQAETSLAEVLVSNGMQLEIALQSGATSVGTILLKAKDASRARYRLQAQFRVKKLVGAGGFSKPLATCQIYRKERGSTVTSYVKVAETEAVASADAIWKPISMTVQELCGGNTSARCIKLQVTAAAKEVGYCHVSIDDILSHSKFSLRSAAGKACGTLILLYYNLTEEPSFLDCIQDGWELSPIIAIDYTASNGNPSTPTSLHYVEQGRLNEYEQTIKAVGEVLEIYTKNADIPVFGYGALLPKDHQVSHCFALSGNDKEPEASGVEGVLEMYRESLAHVVLKGPTVFTHVIRKAMDIVHTSSMKRGGTQRKRYWILLIVTDGIIFDWKDTMDAIVEANSLPLSIAIVGVGSPADFDKMSALYSENLRSSTGEGIRRKNVTFVPLREYYEAVNVCGSFESIPMPGTASVAESTQIQNSVHYSRLAMPTLSQLPQEMLEYLLINNVTTTAHAPETDAMMPQSMNSREPTGGTEPPQWQSDAEASACSLCETVFSFTNRKHHCRACGALVCKECSANSRPIPQYSLLNPERCCDDCYAVLLRGGVL